MTADTLNIAASDHAPILVSLISDIPLRPRPFRFEAMWLLDGACDNTFHNAWNCCFHLSSQLVVSKKILRIKKDLVSWNKFVFGNVQRHIQLLEQKLSDL